MLESRLNIRKTTEISKPHYYVRALMNEYSQWAFDETRALDYKGEWRGAVFHEKPEAPMDLEIGTGNGYFFAHRAKTHPNRCLVGLELKFKPAIQTIRRVLSEGCENARMVRFHARFIDRLFEKEELNHIFIHHPDPWTRRKKQKHRLLQAFFLKLLWDLQRPGSFLEFKTDSLDYFKFVESQVKDTDYQVEKHTYDLHSSEWANENFTTHFEKIFIRQGIKINYMLLRKPNT